MLFPEQEPQIESTAQKCALDYIVLYLSKNLGIDASNEKEAHSRLGTLLFLVDWKAAIETGTVLTGFGWMMTSDGPIACLRTPSPTYEDASVAIERSGSEWQIDKILNHVVGETQSMTNNEINRLAFNTYPSFEAYNSTPQFPSTVTELIATASRYEEYKAA